MQLVNIGSGNLVNAERIIAVVSPDSAPVKRLISDGKERGSVIDATHGRKTKSVLLADSDHIILSYLAPDKLAERFGARTEEDE